MKEANPMKRKFRVISMLCENGCTDEKSLQELDMEQILRIPGISIADMTIILELQKHTKAGKLFSYLGGDSCETPGQ